MNKSFTTKTLALDIKAQQLLTGISEQAIVRRNNLQLRNRIEAENLTRVLSKLPHRMQRHQIELEMQNDSLRQTNIVLQQSNDHYLDLYESAPVAYLTLTKQGLIKEINLASEALFGLKRQHLLQQYFSGFINPTDQNRWLLFFTQLLKQNQPRTSIDLSLSPANGNQLYAQLDCLLVLDNGLPSLRIALTDITRFKQAEFARQDNDAYRSILATTRDGFWVVNHEGKLIDVNDRYSEQSGYSRAELLQMSIPELEVIENPNDVAARIKRIIENGADLFETLQRRKDGTFWDVEVSVTHHDLDGGIFYVFLRDITRRKQAENALKANEALISSILNSLALQVKVLDAKGIIIAANKAWQEFAKENMPSGDYNILGHNYLDVCAKKLEQDDQTQKTVEIFQAVTAILIGEQQVFHTEYSCDSADGQRWFHMSVMPLQGENGAVICHEEITERKRFEEKIRQLSDSELNKAKLAAEHANKAKSEFLSSMSHELRTPMNAVLGFAQLLELEDLTKDQLDSVQYILASGYHLLDLINEVLDLSKIEADKLELNLEKLNLNALMQQCLIQIQSFATKNQIEIVNGICKDCHFTVVGDSLRFKQILLNLISNAIKYNRAGGSVTLCCEIINSQTGRIKVIDTGDGLSEMQISKLFQPFERLQAKNSTIEGTGIGLCISKKLIEAMNGKIGVESTIGEGSCFWIEIPLD